MKSATQSKAEAQTNKPIHVLRLKGVKCSIWANAVTIDGRATTLHKVVVQKLYKDEHKEFKSTASLGRDDLPVASLLLQDAYRFILEAEAQPNQKDAT